MSVYKPKNSPYWHFDFQFKGVRFHGSTGTTSKAAARQIEARERTRAASGRRQRQPMTLDTAAGRYFLEKAQHQPSSATTRYQLANLIDRFGAATLLADITDNEIAEYVMRRRAQVSNASVNRETQLLKRVFRRADTVWKADIGDMPDWRELMVTEPAGRVRELTDDEEARLFGDLRGDFHPMVKFCLMTGQRLMSVLRLTWAAVDFENREITLRVKSKRPGGEVHRLPITGPMLALLAEQRGAHPIFVFTYVCKRSRGQRRQGERYPFSQGCWRRDWGKALRAAGIEDFRFHDTRHTAATRTLRVTGNLKVVQNMLHHADIATTARYAHATTADVREAMEAAQSRNTPEAAAVGIPNPLKRRA